MSGWAIAFGTTGMILSVVTAMVTGYRAWRKRVQDAAKKPFEVGTAAVDAARVALQFKDERLKVLSDELEKATARAGALQEQVEDLYTRTGRLAARNAELEEQVRMAAERERASTAREERDRARIRELELRVDELSKQVGPGPI